jgi:hypothetical protein
MPGGISAAWVQVESVLLGKPSIGYKFTSVLTKIAICLKRAYALT